MKTSTIKSINWIDYFTAERYEAFGEYCKPDMTVMDIGCHTGRGGAAIKRKLPTLELYGVEMSKDAIEYIPENVYELVFNDSINNLTLDLKFDRIIAGEVVEHMPTPEFLSMLKVCKGMLKENGLILLTTPNPDFILVRLGRDSVLKEASHINIMSIKKFRMLVSESGLFVKKIIGSGKASRYLGTNFPLDLYGSYLAILENKWTPQSLSPSTNQP